MARTQFTFTFSNAESGAHAHFSAPVFASATATSPDGTVQLSAANTVSVWADAGYLIAATVDGNGQEISATATAASPTITVDAGSSAGSPFSSAPAAWAASTQYLPGRMITGPAPYYGTWLCLTGHTSGGTFSGWSAGNWQWVGGSGYGTAANKPSATSGPNGYLYWETDTNGGTPFVIQAAAWVQAAPGVTAANGYQIDYAENITGTVQNTGAGTTSVIDITSLTLTVPATARPVYMKVGARLSVAAVTGTPAQTVQGALLTLVETTSGTTTIETLTVPIGVAVASSGHTYVGEVRLGASSSGTRTFKWTMSGTGTSSNGYSVAVSNTSGFRSWCAAIAA